MKIKFLVFFLVILSCSDKSKSFEPRVNPDEIQENFIGWWNYQSNHIMLSRDFIAFDEDSKKIDKETFLEKLIEGNTIPIRLQSNDQLFKYKLYKILPNTDENIKSTIIQTANDEIIKFKLEGTPFPNFDFKDLDGKTVSSASMKGKIMVVKCWFINCSVCVKEFPSLNKMVKDYKNREDIVFVSFALDTAEKLRSFLIKKPLSYSVVPNLKNFITEDLKVTTFPTHFIVNKQGIILKVLTNEAALKVALKIESKK